MAISFSMPYQLPRPLPPQSRLPMASTSLSPPECFTLSGSAPMALLWPASPCPDLEGSCDWVCASGFFGSLFWPLVGSCAKAVPRKETANKTTVARVRRDFIATPAEKEAQIAGFDPIIRSKPEVAALHESALLIDSKPNREFALSVF